MRRFFRGLISLLILISITSVKCLSQDIPDKPVPPRLVNDFTQTLSQQEVNTLERKLVAFNDSTSTQIAIVIVPSLEGYDKSDYAQRLGEKWGIGQKGRDNGILILIKPKTDGSSGQVFIAPGYGLEGIVPDLTAAEIVDNEMIPALSENDYYGALDKATSTLMALASGEFSAAQYGRKAHGKQAQGAPMGLIIFIIVIIIAMISGRSGGSGNKHISSRGLPFWMLMGMLGSGGSHRGSWGGFSGGGSSGGGGFGGFGGGSFGGGGAGGSW